MSIVCCPQGVKIPRVFELMNYHQVYGLTEYAREEYKKLLTGTKGEYGPEKCIECGGCETKCPQKIEIIRQLKESQKALA